MTIGSLFGGFLANTFRTPIIIEGIPYSIPPALFFMIASIMISALINAKEHRINT